MEAPGRERDLDPRALALCVLVILAFVTRVLGQFDDRLGDDYQFHTLLLPVDLGLAAALVLGLREVPAAVRHWREHPVVIAGAAMGVFLLPALVAHPSDRGVAALLRWFAVCAAALLLTRLRPVDRRIVLLVLAGATAVSSCVAIGQRLADDALGLSFLGESEDAVIDIGAPAVSGLLVHPYVMAAWVAVVSIGIAAVLIRQGSTPPPHVLGLLFVMAAPFGMSMARSAALAGVGACAALSVAAWRRRNLIPAAVVTAGFAAGALVNAGGWVDRVDVTVPQTTASGRSIDVTAGRGQLVKQARGLFDEDPVLGVGPGRYVIALAARPDLTALSRQAPRPVHNVPLLLIVEGGIVVVPALMLLIAAIAWAAWRARLLGVAVALAYLPFLLLDHLAWSFPQGLVLTGLWFGFLDLLPRSMATASRDRRGVRQRTAAL